MRSWSLISAAAIATILSIGTANASVVFLATLSGAAQVPPSNSTATGSARVILESDNNTLDVNLTFSGLVGGPATAAHIHCCAPATVSAGVALPFLNFPSATSGTYTNSFDLTTSLAAGFLASGFQVADFIVGLDAGLAYINIHDATYPGGEIRGQLREAAVPEPSTLGLATLGLIGVIFAGRRRSRGGLVAFSRNGSGRIVI